MGQKPFLKAAHFSHTANHDEDAEGFSWLLLVRPAQEVVADDVDQTGLQVVFGLYHHVDAVRTQGGKPASEGLSAYIYKFLKNYNPLIGFQTVHPTTTTTNGSTQGSSLS